MPESGVGGIYRSRGDVLLPVGGSKSENLDYCGMIKPNVVLCRHANVAILWKSEGITDCQTPIFAVEARLWEAIVRLCLVQMYEWDL